MDSRAIDFCTNFVHEGSSTPECKHRRPSELCENQDCQETLHLYQQAIREKDQEKRDWIHAQRARKRRGKKKSQYELALEKSRVFKPEHYEIKLPKELVESESDQRKIFRNLFADEITFRAALQFRALTLRQACLLKAYLASYEDMSNYRRWEAIGKRLGVSGKTVEREFLKLVEKFLKTNNASTNPRVVLKHVRGERKPRYYRIRSIQIGEWRRESSELVTDENVIRGLRRQRSKIIRSEKTPVRSSPVNRLCGAVIRQFASDLPCRDDGPLDVDSRDLQYNLRWTEGLLARKGPGSWTALDIYRILSRGARPCRGCRTILIRGFRINGRRITRAREFCDDACKMRAERRKMRLLK